MRYTLPKCHVCPSDVIELFFEIRQNFVIVDFRFRFRCNSQLCYICPISYFCEQNSAHIYHLFSKQYLFDQRTNLIEIGKNRNQSK